MPIWHKLKGPSKVDYNSFRSEQMYRRFKDLREDSDYTQGYLANYLSCSQSAYSKIESGRRQLSIDYLINLSALYSVSTDYLLELTDYPYRLNSQK